MLVLRCRIHDPHPLLGLTAALALASAGGCGGGEPPDGPSDAGAGDADAGDAARPGPDIPWLDDGAPPIALTPCPEGWREVPPQSTPGMATCAPYPEDGPTSCGAGQAHFPGEPGCVPIGAPCPEAEWPEGLPEDGSVLFVRAGASTGDGSRSAPFGRIGDAMPRAGEGTTIALAKGRYDEVVEMRAGVTLRGACAAETVVAAASGPAVVTVTVPDARLRDLTIGESGTVGVDVHGGEAALEARGLLVDGAAIAGLVVGERASLDATTVVVRETAAAADGRFGRGLNVQGAATARASRVLFERNRDVGVFVIDDGSRVVLQDAVARDTRERRSDGSLGRGLNVEGAGAAEVSRALFERNREAAIFVGDEGSSLTLTEAVARDTLGRNDGLHGRGINVERGGSAELSHILFERNREFGILVSGARASLVLEDAIVRDTRPSERDELGDEQTRGRGLNVQLGGSAELSRVLLERNHEAGIVVVGADARLALTDATIRDTFAQPSTETFGRGLTVQGGASAEVTRALVERNRELGVVVDGTDSRLVLADTVVRETRPRLCAESSCGDSPGGHGVGSYRGASLDVTGFEIARSSLCGLQIALEGEADLRRGAVVENSTGACLQVDGYDIERLTEAVRYVDNDTTLETTSLPVPEPTEGPVP